MNSKYLSILLLVTFLSCQEKEEDNCLSSNFEKQFLMEASKTYYLYEGVQKAIFVDADSNEYEFSVDYSGINESNFDKQIQCKDSSYQNITFDRELAEVRIVGNHEGFYHDILISLTTGFRNSESNFEENQLVDVLKVSHEQTPMGEAGPPARTYEYITSSRGGVVDINSANDDYTVLENYERFGRNFSSVIEHKANLDNGKYLYYSKEQGVVAFTNLFARLMVLDRIEF